MAGSMGRLSATNGMLHIVTALITVGLVVGLCGPARGTQEGGEPKSAVEPNADNVVDESLGTCLRLIEQGRFDEARKLVESIVALQPRSSRAHLVLALTYHKQRRYGVAKPIFERAIQLDPEDRLILPYYGWCLYYLGEADASRAQFEQFAAFMPEHADAHYALGLLDFDGGKREDAKRQFDLAIEFARKANGRIDEAKSRARLADVLVREGEWEKAKKELERSVALNPELYGAYFRLSRVLQRLGDEEGAQQARRMHDEVRRRLHPEQGHPE